MYANGNEKLSAPLEDGLVCASIKVRLQRLMKSHLRWVSRILAALVLKSEEVDDMLEVWLRQMAVDVKWTPEDG